MQEEDETEYDEDTHYSYVGTVWGVSALGGPEMDPGAPQKKSRETKVNLDVLNTFQANANLCVPRGGELLVVPPGNK